MKLLLQRVRRAAVAVEEQTVGEIGQGLLVFVGVEKAMMRIPRARLLAGCSAIGSSPMTLER